MDKEGDSISQQFINEYQALSKVCCRVYFFFHYYYLQEEPNLSMEEMFAKTEKRLEDVGLYLRRQPKKESTEETKKASTEESNTSGNQ